MGKFLEQAKNAKRLFNESAQVLEGNDALEAMKLYSPYSEWNSFIGETIMAGTKVVYNSELWKVRQNHLVQAQYFPSTDTASLYERIEEGHTGTYEDPIPYDQNLAVFSGLYYVENGTVYKCTRDSGNPLYNTCASLVGVYFQVA